MFRQFSSNAFHFRRFSYLKHSPYGSQTYGSRIRSRHFIASSTAVAATLLWYSTTTVIHSDSLVSDRVIKARDDDLTMGLTRSGPDGTLNSVVWGSNKSNAIAPQSPEVDSIRTPLVAVWLQNVALRDLALHDDHAACVDARGDIYQWGNGFFGPPSISADDNRNRGPTRTLRDKNIIRLALTESRVFALSACGHIYVLAADSEKQSPKSSTSPWYRPGWLLRKEETVDFVEILPKHHLSWREKFVAISAGTDHLLALTSSGRAFAHPISKKANTHGQLGFRKFDIPIQSSEAISPPSRLAVELTPKIITDPYAKASTSSRPDTPSSNTLQLFDDDNIRFSDTLFEIPALRGVNVAQAVAAGRTSFVRTCTGKVLGWGANENAQIGLGSNVTLDAITVPMEVVLWRTVSNKTQSRCLNICSGGDLTCFTVERIDENDVRTVDLLMCGNGRWGGLGNNIYSSAQGNPLHAKSVSGLLEYSEKEQALQPIIPHAISISPTGHVLLTLETHGPGGGGRDLFVWGANQQYELGTGKRTSLAAPSTLQQANEARFMLMKAEADVNDMQGKAWKRRVEVEQCAQAGYGNTIVYWKIC